MALAGLAGIFTLVFSSGDGSENKKRGSPLKTRIHPTHRSHARTAYPSINHTSSHVAVANPNTHTASHPAIIHTMMRVFSRRHVSSPGLLCASFPLCSFQNVCSLLPSHYTCTHRLTPIKRPICYASSWPAGNLVRISQQQLIGTSGKHQSTTRLFGSPAETNEPGEINLSDDREDTQTITIDIPALHKTIDTVREIIGYPTYDVSCQLIDEEYMKEINSETRGMDKSTDVLSFCFMECEEPGILKDVPSHAKSIGEMYCLGDLLVCVDYVAKRCEEDRRSGFTISKPYNDGIMEGEVVQDSSAGDKHDDEDSDGEYEYQDIEVEVEDEWDDRGVAPALLTTYDPEIRIHMLIVHGMLHLVGYDHIEDDEYELMVEKEDEVMAELKRRLGDDFGLGISRRALAAGN